jgi:hypothetical protein
MNEARVGGEELELIEEAFRGMKAERQADGWISVTGRLDPVPGEALLRALRATERELPRRLGSTRDEHRAAALDEIARQVELLIGSPSAIDADEEIVRADPGDDDASADTRVRGRVDTSRHPSGLSLVKTPS